MSFLGLKHNIRTFDPKQLRVQVAGFDLVGFADTKVEVRLASDAFKKVIGCEGEFTRVQSNDTSGTITVHLHQSSPSNALLSGMHFVDKFASTVVPVTVFHQGSSFSLNPLNDEQFNLKTKIFSLKTWIKRMPDMTYGNSLNIVSWVFESSALTLYYGGEDESGQLYAEDLTLPRNKQDILTDEDGKRAAANIYARDLGPTDRKPFTGGRGDNKQPVPNTPVPQPSPNKDKSYMSAGSNTVARPSRIEPYIAGGRNLYSTERGFILDIAGNT